VFFDTVGVLSVPPQFSNTEDLTHANDNPGFWPTAESVRRSGWQAESEK